MEFAIIYERVTLHVVDAVIDHRDDSDGVLQAANCLTTLNRGYHKGTWPKSLLIVSFLIPQRFIAIVPD